MKTILLAFLIVFSGVWAEAAQVNKVAAVVNGQVITMFDLQKEAIPELARARIAPNELGKSRDADAILRRALDNMIMDILIAQEAKRLNIGVTRNEIDGEIKRLMMQKNLTKKQFEAELARQKLSPETLRKQLEKVLLRQKIVGREVGRKVVVTPQEISDYYEAHKGELYNRDGLHMGLLVYHPKADAAAIARQIKSGKMSFADACAKYSIAPNRDKGGDTGPVEWERLNPEWGGRLNRMRPGDVTDLFQLDKFKAQIHLFRPGGGETKQLTLQEATPQIDQILRMPKAQERFSEYSKQLRDKAVIDIRL